MQSTMDPLVHGIRLGFAYGDFEFAVGNVLVRNIIILSLAISSICLSRS